MKTKLLLLTAIALPFLFSCGEEKQIDGGPHPGAVEILKDGKYVLVYHETVDMPSDQDEMFIEFRSSTGVYNGPYNFKISSVSGDINAEVCDPIDGSHPRRPDDSIYSHGDGQGGMIYKYYYHQKVKVTAPGHTSKLRVIKFSVFTCQTDGEYSSFTVIKRP